MKSRDPGRTAPCKDLASRAKNLPERSEVNRSLLELLKFSDDETMYRQCRHDNKAFCHIDSDMVII